MEIDKITIYSLADGYWTAEIDVREGENLEYRVTYKRTEPTLSDLLRSVEFEFRHYVGVDSES